MKKFIQFMVVCMHTVSVIAGEDRMFTKFFGEDDNGIKGKVILGAGLGFNILGTSLTVKYDQSNYYRPFDIRGTGTSKPMFNVSFDYGLLKRFFIGTAFGYQTATVVVTDYNGYYVGTDTWQRIHVAVRSDYSIVAKKNANLYTGLKVGFNRYVVTSTITSRDPLYIGQLDVYPSVYSIQAHFGFSYYFGGVIGFNTEVGLGYGGPYLAAVGLTVKI